jgi:hypothetical protein
LVLQGLLINFIVEQGHCDCRANIEPTLLSHFPQSWLASQHFLHGQEETQKHSEQDKQRQEAALLTRVPAAESVVVWAHGMGKYVTAKSGQAFGGC